MLALYTNLACRFRRDEKGATAVEYGIMVALIAVVIIVAVTLLGNNMYSTFDRVACEVKGGTYPTPAPSAGTAAGAACTVP